MCDAVESKVFGIGAESCTIGSHEFYMGCAMKHKKLLTLDTGHFHPTEVVSDKLSSALQYLDGVMLHVSRPVRWDSDHVVIFDDELKAMAEKTYTVTSYAANVDNELKVYKEDCTTVKDGPTLNKYEQVTVTVLKIKGIELWCRVEFSDHDGNNQDGYVNMKHLTLGVVQDPDKVTNKKRHP